MTLIDFKARQGLREHFCLTSRIAADSHRLPRSHAQLLAQPCCPLVTHFPSWKHKSCLSPEPLVCALGSLTPPLLQSRAGMLSRRQGPGVLVRSRRDQPPFNAPAPVLNPPLGSIALFWHLLTKRVTRCCPSTARQAAGGRNATVQERMLLAFGAKLENQLQLAA